MSDANLPHRNPNERKLRLQLLGFTLCLILVVVSAYVIFGAVPYLAKGASEATLAVALITLQSAGIPIYIRFLLSPSTNGVLRTIGAMTIALIAGLCCFILWTEISAWIPQPELPSRVGKFLIGTTSLALGAILFIVRLKIRFLYGLSETIVGVAIAIQRVASEASHASSVTIGISLAFLTAGVYLIVRGIDNMHYSLTKPPLDLVAIKLLSFFYSGTGTMEERKP